MSLRRGPWRAWPALAAALLAGAPAWAEEAGEVASFAFASRLGSGIYDIHGRTVQIYRIPIAFDVLRVTDERHWGLRLRVPLTVGFYDFRLEDLPSAGLPDNFGTLGLAPGLWFEVPVHERWTLWPFAEGGPIWDFETGSTSWVYTGGLRSEVVLPQSLEWVARNELAWTGASGPGRALDDAFGELRTGGEVWGELPASVRGSRLLLGGFAVNYLYWKRAEFLNEELQQKPYLVQWEAGVLLRARPALYVWKVKLPDIGLSYRFGDQPGSVRLIFGRSF